MYVRTLLLFVIVVGYSMSASAMLGLRVARVAAMYASRAMVPYAGSVAFISAVGEKNPLREKMEEEVKNLINGRAVLFNGKKYVNHDSKLRSLLIVAAQSAKMKVNWSASIGAGRDVAVPIVEEGKVDHSPIQFVMILTEEGHSSSIDNRSDFNPKTDVREALLNLRKNPLKTCTNQRFAYVSGWPILGGLFITGDEQCWGIRNVGEPSFPGLNVSLSLSSPTLTIRMDFETLMASQLKLSRPEKYVRIPFGGFDFKLTFEQMKQIYRFMEKSENGIVEISMLPPMPNGSIYAGIAPLKVSVFESYGSGVSKRSYTTFVTAFDN